MTNAEAVENLCLLRLQLLENEDEADAAYVEAIDFAVSFIGNCDCAMLTVDEPQ